jgi:hypothetical protein
MSLPKLPTIKGLPDVGRLKVHLFKGHPELNIKKLMHAKLAKFMQGGRFKKVPKAPKVTIKLPRLEK